MIKSASASRRTNIDNAIDSNDIIDSLIIIDIKSGIIDIDIDIDSMSLMIRRQLTGRSPDEGGPPGGMLGGWGGQGVTGHAVAASRGGGGLPRAVVDSRSGHRATSALSAAGRGN